MALAITFVGIMFASKVLKKTVSSSRLWKQRNRKREPKAIAICGLVSEGRTYNIEGKKEFRLQAVCLVLKNVSALCCSRLLMEFPGCAQCSYLGVLGRVK